MKDGPEARDAPSVFGELRREARGAGRRVWGWRHLWPVRWDLKTVAPLWCSGVTSSMCFLGLRFPLSLGKMGGKGVGVFQIMLVSEFITGTEI